MYVIIMQNVYPITLKTEKQRAALFDNIVYAYGRQPAIRRKTQEILRDAGIRRQNNTDIATAVFDYVQQNLPYILEAGEMIETPAYSLRNLSLGADCDGHALLVSALLESVSVPTKLLYWIQPGHTYASHVSAAYWNGSSWINLDTSQNKPMGWTPAGWSYAGSDGEPRPALDLETGADMRSPVRMPGQVPALGWVSWSDLNPVNLGKKLYGAAKWTAGKIVDTAEAIAEEGLELLEAGAEILGEIPLVGDMLEAVATAIIATIANFVEDFFSLLRTIGGVVEKWFTKIAEKLTEWAQDWKTWARMALYIVGCAGAAAAAGAATAGAGAVAVAAGCAGTWATQEVTALAVDLGTEAFEELTGIDIPDYLEPANLQRLATDASAMYDQLGDIALDELADSATTYAMAELSKQAERLPERLGNEIAARARRKLNEIPGFRELSQAAQLATEQKLEQAANRVQGLGQRAEQALQTAEQAVKAVPSWGEMDKALQETLARAYTEQAPSVDGLQQASAQLEAQIADIATARQAGFQETISRTTGEDGFTAAAKVIAKLDTDVTQFYVKPIADTVFREADLEEILPLTDVELEIFKRAGKWQGDTGAKMLTTGAVTPELTVYRGGDISDPVAGAKKVLEYRAKGLNENNPLLQALKAGGKQMPIVNYKTFSAYVVTEQTEPSTKSVIGPVLLGAAAGAGIAYLKGKT